MLRAEKLAIAGPAGALEAVVEQPEQGVFERFAVVCHPHPLHGGTLTNKVVHTVARALYEVGMPTIRFNFRGVGASDGAFDNGVGETEDALAVAEWGRARWPGAALWLAGFSFGGAVAVRAAARASAQRVIAVAPAIGRIEVGTVRPECPWLIVQGDADDVVEPHAVMEWAAQLNPAPTVALLPGVGHFFHGRLHDLRDTVVDFARRAGPQDAARSP